MIKLIKNADIYAPAHLGMGDILIAGERICAIDRRISGYDNLPHADIFDAEGKKLIPGYIDVHVHITGGGGEQGPTSRVPESQLSAFLKNGITTVLGLLGTDGITRSLENLVAKAKALNEEGITAYALTGCYGYPPITVTGSVERDIVMVSPIIGAKIAVSDHRSSNPSAEDIIRIATAARRAGLIGGTPGLLVMHMGAGKAGLEPVLSALEKSDLPLKNLLPTHIQRSALLVEQGMKLVRKGGYVDFTAGCCEQELIAVSEVILDCLSRQEGAADHITLSSDAYGSQPRFDEKGECIGLTYASPDSLHKTIKLLLEKGLELEEAIKPLTTTPAMLLGKSGVKGCIKPGADADMMILDENLEIDSLFARGREAVCHKKLVMKGMFE